MLTIQTVGSEILQKNPRKFYVFAGSEYGVKEKYISILQDHYGTKIESPSVVSVLDNMATKHFVPLVPTVYVVRYDDTFVAALDAVLARRIETSKIVGTIVCIIEQNKHAQKVDKFLPNNIVTIDEVHSQFLTKYLHQDFPTLPDRFINIAAETASNYSHARHICYCMSQVSVNELFELSDASLKKLFGVVDTVTESDMKIAVAARNFARVLEVIQHSGAALETLHYTILNTMIEIDKLLENKYTESVLRNYVKRWSHQDTYNMFMNTYSELQKIRSISVDTESSLIYLAALLQFTTIPAKEALQ